MTEEQNISEVARALATLNLARRALRPGMVKVKLKRGKVALVQGPVRPAMADFAHLMLALIKSSNTVNGALEAGSHISIREGDGLELLIRASL
ncbi:MAG: hypothetical protein IOC82_06625 [Aestuariivirga sp.]|uniref:hypothetical protein n=1 Tax=Aestuariivirga sp. TaxID=2650926 RepID=UPI0025BB2A0E|nr:hypothetical protein [Aestuariivirga sp.]MCA3560691.1 hypothetical protein [Aestuariivirga sp.]